MTSQEAVNEEERRLVFIVEFTVRNDKHRGLLVEKFSTQNNEFYFKTHDQPIQRHCEDLRNIIKASDIQRTKNIRVNIVKFAYEYYRNDVATFRGVPLNSTNQRINKICELYVNKEAGARKRTTTIAQNKPRKISEYNAKIYTKMEEAEARYRELRAIKMNELMGRNVTRAPRGPTGPNRPQGSVTVSTVTSHAGLSSAQDPLTPQVPTAFVPHRPVPRDNAIDAHMSDDDF